MGGATSKLLETDWHKADGKLKDPSETVDGAPPTQCYQIYYLTKRAVNQREFDITDSESNLIYTTRQVPGTIACFDVLGKEIDSHLLRVTVDIARRYWTVYRFEIPTFEGQKPDKEATEKLAAERLQKVEDNPMVENFNTACLFRKAVVVVSWSRYMAVSTFYGPPTEEMVQKWEAEEAAKKKEEEDAAASNGLKKQGLIYQPVEDESKSVDSGMADSISRTFQCAVVQDSPSSKKLIVEGDVEEQTPPPPLESTATLDLQEVDVNDDISDVEVKSTAKLETVADGQIGPMALQKLYTERFGMKASSLSAAEMRRKLPILTVRTTAELTAWAKQKSQHFREKSRSALQSSGIMGKIERRDPGEGVVHLNKPMLLCQEIYTRIIGNHQTSLISKEKALELLQQDIAQHEKDDPGSTTNMNEEIPIMTGQEVILRSLSQDSGDGEPEHKSVEPEEDSGNGSSNGQEHSLHSIEKKLEETEKEQELVGYWLWENTLRTHKIKLHMAQGSDLALHVVLAIIVNQVRYERNAVALTI